MYIKGNSNNFLIRKCEISEWAGYSTGGESANNG